MDDDYFKKNSLENTDFGIISYFGKPHKNETKLIWCRVPFVSAKWNNDVFVMLMV